MTDGGRPLQPAGEDVVQHSGPRAIGDDHVLAHRRRHADGFELRTHPADAQGAAVREGQAEQRFVPVLHERDAAARRIGRPDPFPS